MRRFFLAGLSISCFVVSGVATAFAHEANAESTSRTSAAVSAAQQRMHSFLFVEYPQYVRLLGDKIELAEAEVEIAAARVANYAPFRSFHEYSPTYAAEQNWRLELLAGEQRLRQLKRQRSYLSRYRRDAVRQLRYQIELAERTSGE